MSVELTHFDAKIDNNVSDDDPTLVVRSLSRSLARSLSVLFFSFFYTIETRLDRLGKGEYIRSAHTVNTSSLHVRITSN